MADDGDDAGSQNYRMLGDFDSIVCGAGVDGRWGPDPVSWVAGLATEPGSLDALKITLEGTTLRIERADPSSEARVHVSAESTQLKSIELAGDASFTLRELDAQAFSCSAADGAKLWVKGKAGEAHASARGHATIVMSKLDAGVCSFKGSDDAKGWLHFSDAGSVTLTGRAKATAAGSGQLWAKLSDEAELEAGADIRIGKLEADGKARMSILPHGDVEVGDVEKAAAPKAGPLLH